MAEKGLACKAEARWTHAKISETYTCSNGIEKEIRSQFRKTHRLIHFLILLRVMARSEAEKNHSFALASHPGVTLYAVTVM